MLIHKLLRTTIIVLFFFLLAGIGKIQATHIVGGEITYKCLGSNQYEITLTVYRDCFYGNPEAFFDSIGYIGVFDGAATLVDSLLIPFDPASNDTLDAVFADTCLFVPGDVCVHTTFYRDTITLLPGAGGYTLTYMRCCRNETILNIQSPNVTGSTFSVEISEKALFECNSGPEFKEWPPIFICVNEPIEYDHSAIDAEGDSLAYKLCTPIKGATITNYYPQPPFPPPYDPVVWVPPYDLNNLLGGVPLEIDVHTGLLTGLPNTVGQFLVGICVEEYRDGELISFVRRDFQYNVGFCGTVIADITAPDNQCDDLTVDFDNTSLNAGDFFWAFNDPGNPGATSTLTEPSFTFSDYGTYTVMLIAEPNSACVDTTFHQITLTQNTLEADFELEIIKCADSFFIFGFDQSTGD